MSKDYPPYLDYPKHRNMNDKEKAFWVKEPDLVEVVRCKDCKNFWESFSGSHSCKLHKGLVGTKYDTFCSYGERKDNG